MHAGLVKMQSQLASCSAGCKDEVCHSTGKKWLTVRLLHCRRCCKAASSDTLSSAATVSSAFCGYLLESKVSVQEGRKDQTAMLDLLNPAQH